MRTVNVENYFPIHLVVLGYGLIVAGLFTFSTNTYLTMVFLPVGILFANTHHGFLLDTENHKYHEYISIFWFKTGKAVSFETIQYAFIQSTNNSASYGAVGMRKNVNFKELNGYIKFSDSEKIHIGTGSRNDLRSTFMFLAGDDVEIKDFTSE